MKKANEHGVYETEVIEEIARIGRAYAQVEICQCEDGLYRYGLDMMYSYGGFCGPIYARSPGFCTQTAAKDDAIQKLLERSPKSRCSDPKSVHAELRELRMQIERAFRQPSLF